MKSYKDLMVYEEAFQLSKEIHCLSQKMPKSEMFELGSQIRRSAQSVRANIVEGYGRRRYKQEFVRFLIQAHASCLETISHADMISELYPKIGFKGIIIKYEALGARLFNFIVYVETNWKSKTHNP